jgi:hypothetical protein
MNNNGEDQDKIGQIIIDIIKKNNLNSEKIDKYFTKGVPEALSESTELLLNTLKSTASNMLRERRKLTSGFESRLRKVWGKSFNLLEMLLVISLEVGEDFNKKFRPNAIKNKDFVFDVLTRLHARACQISYEILTLLKSGYADGAHARWRTLHEIAATAYFIKKYGNDTAECYLLHEKIESYKAMLQYQEFCNKLGEEPFSEEQKNRLISEKDAVLKRFGNNFFNNYGWASDVLNKKNPKFCEIEKDAEIEHFRPYYKMSSYNVHATPKGIMFKLGLSPNVNFLLTGPSNAGLADPGQSTAISLTQITTALLLSKPNYDRIVILKVMLLLVEEIKKAFIDAHEYIEEKTRYNLRKQKLP